MSFQIRKQSLVSTDVGSSVGTVAGVLLLALSPGRSGYSDSDSLKAGTRDLAIVCTTDSWGHVYLPWFRAVYTHSGCTLMLALATNREDTLSQFVSSICKD